MKVENLNGYANQFLMVDKNRITFQSYDSRIAEYNEETNILKVYDDWDYSNTTRRHFKAFINEHTPFNYVDKQQWLKEIENNDNIEVI